ncbi:MAG TPA: tetratricopeptide repeat protein [candidate division Zixibacteria bacterium]|nr:tetratricopeptide repeat protein [candidate division Zixibacteria bacterium]
MNSADNHTLRDLYRKRAWTDCLERGPSVIDELARDGARGELAAALVHYGEALRQTGDVECARACFEASVETAPEEPAGYLQWTTLEAQQGNRGMAQRVARAGVQRARVTTELEMLQLAVIDAPTVSACLIVRNEEDHLRRCLASVRDVCDEIIVVDTGSEDRTIEIAREYGCRVFEQPWEGDFSKHRNYSLAQATGDWILIIDADEELLEADQKSLKAALRQSECPIISITVYNQGERSGKGMTCLPSIRLFRRELELRYEGIVHNRLVFNPQTPQLRAPIRLMHYGYDLEPEKMRHKHQRSKELLLRQIAAEPENYFAHFNLAQLIRAESNLRDAESRAATLAHARKTLELTDPEQLRERPFHIMALHQAATALYAQREFEEAERYCLQALQLKPDYLDAIITLGYVYQQNERLAEAEARFEEYLRLQAEFSEHTTTDGMLIIHLKSRHNALYNLGLIAESRGEWELAEERYGLCLAEVDSFLDALARQGWALLNLERGEEAVECFERQIAMDPSQALSWVGMATACEREGAVELAEERLRAGLAVAGDRSLLYVKLIELLCDSDRTAEAAEVAETAQRECPQSGPALVAAGSAFTAAGRYRDAADVYQSAERVAPGTAETSLGLANALFLAEDFTAACRWYGETLRRDPNHAWAKRNLGLALTRIERYREAEPHLAAYVAAAPEDRQARAIYGALLLESGQEPEALALFEELVRDDPSDAGALLALADCYLRLGSYLAAKAGYERLLAADPDSDIVRERLELVAAKIRE